MRPRDSEFSSAPPGVAAAQVVRCNGRCKRCNFSPDGVFIYLSRRAGRRQNFRNLRTDEPASEKSGGTSFGSKGPLLGALFRSGTRRLPESNRCKRLCRPLRSHSAKAPSWLIEPNSGGFLKCSLGLTANSLPKLPGRSSAGRPDEGPLEFLKIDGQEVPRQLHRLRVAVRRWSACRARGRRKRLRRYKGVGTSHANICASGDGLLPATGLLLCRAAQRHHPNSAPALLDPRVTRRARRKAAPRFPSARKLLCR
jgi:hypothetical protein